MNVNLKDIMSSELREYLKKYRRYVLTVFQGLRSGVISREEAAMSLIGVYSCYFEWKIEWCGYGIAHPCYVFASRILLSAKILMGEDWVNYHLS